MGRVAKNLSRLLPGVHTVQLPQPADVRLEGGDPLGDVLRARRDREEDIEFLSGDLEPRRPAAEAPTVATDVPPSGTEADNKTPDGAGANHADVELVSEAIAGDKVALTRLVKQLTPVVTACVTSALRSRPSARGAGRDIRQEVEDLSQEVFLSLFANDGRVLRSWRANRGLSLENFVGLVSQHRVTSFLRSSRRSPWKEELATVESSNSVDEADPEGMAANRQQSRLLIDRLRENLSPLGFQMFQLLFVRELSLQETMAASGLSADAVYAWRSRLRRLARELTSDSSIGSEPRVTTRTRSRP